MKADHVQIANWIDLVHGRSEGLINICRTGHWSGLSQTEVDDAANYAMSLDRGDPEGVYLRITTLASTLPNREGRRGKDTESLECPGFAGDIDMASDARGTHNERSGLAYPPDETTAMSIVTESGLPAPTLWVHSGWGLYPWWLLTDPLMVDTEEGRAKFKIVSDHIQKTLNYTAHHLGWDYGLGIGDLSRVLRLPGTVNRKVPGTPKMCHVMSEDGTLYELDELADLVARAYERSPKPITDTSHVPRPVYTGSQGLRPGDDFNVRGSWLDLLPQHGWKIQRIVNGREIHWTRPGKDFGISATTGRDASADRLYVFSTSTEFEARTPINKHYALAVLEYNGDVAAATRYLRAQGFGGELPQLHRASDAVSLVRPKAQVTVAEQAVDEQQPQQAALPVQANEPLAVLGHEVPLPEIELGSEQESMVELVRVINSGMIPDLYVKDGQLVRVHPKNDTACAEVNVAPVTADLLNLMLAQHIRTFKWVAGGKDKPPVRKACAPMISHLRAVTSSSYWPNVKPLNGVIGSPTLRPDGSLIQECGYDDATGLYLAPSVPIKRIPDIISDEQVRASREFVFSKVFGEFCWASAGDFTNYLALLLSPMLRPYVKTTTPFGLITATTAGSGKTNLSDAIGMIYGQSSQVWPGRSDELQKKITSILAGNSNPVIVFDNLMEGTCVRSEVLAGLVTKRDWDDRMLGHSRNIEAKNDRLWLATGNGLTVGGDMATRTVLVRLDPRTEKPQLREFEMGQFSDWIIEDDNRANLLFHLLILVQAWMKGGASFDRSHRMRGFTRWAQIMGGLAAFHGLTGFLSNVDELEARDTDQEDWASFLRKWHDIFGSKAQTCKEIQASAQVNFIAGEQFDKWAGFFISDEGGHAPTAKQLGMMLQGRKGKIYGPYTLMSKRNNENTTIWWVEKKEEVSDGKEGTPTVRDMVAQPSLPGLSGR